MRNFILNEDSIIVIHFPSCLRFHTALHGTDYEHKNIFLPSELFFLLMRERETEGEKEWGGFVVPFIYALVV